MFFSQPSYPLQLTSPYVVETAWELHSQPLAALGRKLLSTLVHVTEPTLSLG